MKNSRQVFQFLTLTGFIFTSGCASYRPESIESKMSRFNGPENKVNVVPQIDVTYNKELGRVPSSVKTSQTKNSAVTKLEMDGLKNLSNKKLYFLTLFDQYNQLSKFTPNKTEQIKTCAHFHSGIIEQYGEYPLVNQFKSPISEATANQGNATENTILQLPLQKDDIHPTVAEYFKTQKVKSMYQLQVQAIDIHLGKMHDELSELCKFGSSDNYYIFENLVSYIQDNKLTDSKESLGILMKTTLFTNQVIGHSFLKDKSGRVPAGKNAKNYFIGAVARLNVEWALNYFETNK